MESLDIMAVDSKTYLKVRNTQLENFIGWFNFFLLGIIVGIIAFWIEELEELLIKYSWQWPQAIMNLDLKKGHQVSQLHWIGAYIIYVTFCTSLVLIAAALTLWIAPQAAGSGVAETMAYMNGINYPGFLSFRCLFVKTLGIVLAVAGGLKIGKEGPLAHIGSLVGALVLYIPWAVNHKFRNDRQKRIMVAAGAGVGVSVAFGAPIGGVLFSYEISRASSFWTFGLAWKTFFATSVANFMLTVLIAFKNGDIDQLTNSGRLKFANIDKNHYDFRDIIVFAIIGVLSGLLGSLYIYVNSLITKLRKFLFKDKWKRLIEAGFWAAIGATVFFYIPQMFECSDPLEGNATESGNERFIFYDCQEQGQENLLAKRLFSKEGEILKSFFAKISNPETFNIGISVVFFLIWFWFCAIDYGLAVPAGLFFPGLLMGGALGEFVALTMHEIFPGLVPEEHVYQSMATYAMIGGTSVLAGYTRLSFCLAVVMMETTQNQNLFIPMLIGVIFARGVGNLIIPGLYDVAVKIKQLPIIGIEISTRAKDFEASQVMQSPVQYFNERETVQRVYEMLEITNHNGFPVIDHRNHVVGKISRNFLITIIKNQYFENESVQTHRVFEERKDQESNNEIPPLGHLRYRWQDFNCDLKSTTFDIREQEDIAKAYPDRIIDMRHFMIENPRLVTANTSMWECIRIFHLNSLRHLPVTDPETGKLVGIMTRENIFSFMEQEEIEKDI